MRGATQPAADDLGTPLHDTTFCVVDLETTGGSPEDARITEIGAVKVRGGELLGEFQTLVDPGVPIPPFVSALTGISEHMTRSAPSIEAVIPAFLEFCRDAVFVAHNASFDHRFMQSNLIRLGYPPLGQPSVCTVRLARRLVPDDVPNVRLATLAAAMRAQHEPTHRALADARACCDVFHSLLELAGRWGVTHLDDLLWFQSVRGHPQYRKVRLAEHVPRARGVYLFRDDRGGVIYVGKAANLRARVRSYFSGDKRRGIDDLLRELAVIDYLECATDLDASVLEARLIRRFSPRYNRVSRGRGPSVFIGLSEERFPRLVISRAPKEGRVSLGPVSARAAENIREALEKSGAVRTCSTRIGPRTHFPMCVHGQIGRCPAPCEDIVSPDQYAAGIEPIAQALRGDARSSVETLASRMHRHAGRLRFEEAAEERDLIGALSSAVSRIRATEALVDTGRMELSIDGSVLELRDGRIHAVDRNPLPVDADSHPDEPRLIAGWLARNLKRVTLLSVERPYAMPVAGGRELCEWEQRLKQCKVGA